MKRNLHQDNKRGQTKHNHPRGGSSGLYNSWKGLYTPVAPSETELDDLSESKRQHGDPGVELEFQQQPVQPDEEEEAERNTIFSTKFTAIL